MFIKYAFLLKTYILVKGVFWQESWLATRDSCCKLPIPSGLAENSNRSHTSLMINFYVSVCLGPSASILGHFFLEVSVEVFFG